MKKFDLKKYVKSNLKDLDWMIISTIRIRGAYLNNIGGIMYCRIENSYIVYHQEDRKLFITNGVRDGIESMYLEELYTIHLDRILDFFFIHKLNQSKKNISDKEKQKEEVKRMESLPKSILREYKIDDILEEQ